MRKTEYTKKFFEGQKDKSLASAEQVVPIVIDLVSPKSVVDVGCGVGSWLAVFQNHGVEDILGIDGIWVNTNQLYIPKDRFIAVDLEKEFTISKKSDLAVCLEVGEHLPAKSAEGLVKSLVGSAPIVLFSAAIPYQRGTHHVNEQWPEYWAKIFVKYNYIPVDCIRRRVWENKNVAEHYAQNSILYIQKGCVEDYPKIKQEIEYGYSSTLPLVHPEKYAELINDYYLPLRSAARFLPNFIKNITRKVYVQLMHRDDSCGDESNDVCGI